MTISTNRWIWRSALLCSLIAVLGGLVAVGTPAQATPPAYGDYSCAPEPARFFQLREGNSTYGYTELWSVSVTNPSKVSPTVSAGGWEPIHSFAAPGEVNPVAVAARTTIEYNGGFVTYVYYSGSDGYLYEGRWAPHLEPEWDATRLSGTNQHKYTSLAYDEGVLWGVKAGDLYKMEVAANMTTPTNWQMVDDAWGSPGSFFGVPGAAYAVGFTGATGALRYLRPDGSFVTLRSSGYQTTLLAGIGDGLTYRFFSADGSLQRQTIGAINGSNTEISPLDMVNPYVTTPLTTAPITAVGSQCSSSVSSVRAAMIERAQSWDGVLYSQEAPYHPSGYRRDCSGFVSMVWQLSKPGPDTASLPGYSYEIDWDDLQPGDALLNAGTHVRLFEKWTDSTRTAYWYYEMGNEYSHWNHDFAPVQRSVYQPIRKDGM